MDLVVICGMQDYKVQARLMPLTEIKEIDRVYLIRRQPVDVPGVEVLTPPKWMRRILPLAEIYRFLTLCILSLRNDQAVIYAIYFVPHGIYAGLVGLLFRKRVIQELIGTDRPKVMRSRALFNLLKKADWVGIRGNTSYKKLIELGIQEDQIFRPIAVNALDFDVFKPEPLTKKYDLIYCGRLHRVKRIDMLIRVVAELKQAHPEIKVVLVGDGPERESLEELRKELDLEETIKIIGEVDNNQISEYLNQSRIFVMTSEFEGLPVAMIEALSCGLPVVVPNVGDIGDIAIHGKNALLIETPHKENYVKSLHQLLCDDELMSRLADGALESRKFFVENYSQKKAKEVWEAIFIQ